MSTEVKVEKIPWASLIIITAVASVMGSIVYLLVTPSGTTLQCTFNWGICNRSNVLVVLPIILIILAYPFRKLLRISAAYLTYLYAVGTVICYSNLSGNEAGYLLPVGISYSALYTSAAVRDIMGSWWWVPPNDILNAMMGGNVAVDWGAWAGSIFFWMTFNFALFLFTSGLSLVFRQRWIDVEQIPFPMTMAAHELVRTVDVNRSAERNLKPMMIGLVLGLLFEMPIFLQALFSWFPDFYGWRTNTCPGGIWCIGPSVSLAQSIVGLAMVNKDPVSFCLFFLTPLSVSFNVWFWSLVMFGLEQVAYSMGYYTGIFSLGGSCRLHRGPPNLMEYPPFYWAYISTIGGTIAIAVSLLYNSRSYLRQTFKQALAPHSSLSEEEKAEATSYRTAYMILAAGAIAVVLWLMLGGIDFLLALSTLIFTIFVCGIAGAYIYGQTSFLAVNNLRGTHAYFPLLLRYGGNLPGLDPSLIVSGFILPMFTNGTFLMNFPTAQMMSLKMAKLTGTSNRNTFLVTVVAVLISTPLILMTKVWIVSIYGNRVFTPGGCGIDEVCAGYMKRLPPQALAPLFSYGTIGFVITFALAMLHARFVWFPFEPLGFVIATSMAGQYYGVWSAFFVAWLVKTIVLRVGGSRVYERYGIPVVGGFLGGVVISIFVGSLLLLIRFFIPF